MDIVQARMPVHATAVHELFAEYLRWVCPRIYTEYQAVFEPEKMIVHDMETINIFLPPEGILLLAFEDAVPVGCACTRTIGNKIAEMKRMYVKPEFRKNGIGAALVEESIRRAREAGYVEMRLDSAGFMEGAHRLYRTAGFVQVPPYEESEIPLEYRKHWVFMAKKLLP